LHCKQVYSQKQFTIAWYVDEIRISHVNPDLGTQIINDIEMKFGKLSVSSGHKHKFLGMDINFKIACTITVYTTYRNLLMSRDKALLMK